MKNILIAVGSAALIAGTAQAATVIDEVDFRETKQCALFESRDCSLRVTSRQVVWLFFKQLWFEFVPVLHGLQGRFTAQG